MSDQTPEPAEESMETMPVVSDDILGRTRTPQQYKAMRHRLLEFVSHQLTEADYDGRGYPARVNDYYTLPGASQKALSKKGAELLGDLYRYKIKHMEEVHSVVDKEFMSAVYRCTLHRSGIIVGCREGSCNTAEVTFQRAKKKYGGDWRAAENDVRARAQKRAYVQAMIGACAASDIFAVADETEIPEGDWEEMPGEEAVAGESNGGPAAKDVGQLLELVKHDAFNDAEREKVTRWVNKGNCTPERLEEQVVLAQDRITKWEDEHGPPL